jgi:RNA polymerase sigma factor (sigma-70 family)
MARRPQGDRDDSGHSQRRARILEQALGEGRRALRRQADRSAPQLADAEDALQEACLQFLHYYDGPAGQAALRYLMLAVKHRAWEIAERQRRGSFDLLSGTDAYDPFGRVLRPFSERPGPEERAERSEDVATFFAALARLKPDERTALLLLGLGYSYAEIGARQSWSPTKVNRCLAEGRAALRAIGVGGEFSPLTLLDE